MFVGLVAWPEMVGDGYEGYRGPRPFRGVGKLILCLVDIGTVGMIVRTIGTWTMRVVTWPVIAVTLLHVR